MSNLTKLDHEEVREALAEHQLTLLEDCAKETGLPSHGWTAVPGLLLLAKVWATRNVAAQLVGKIIDEHASSRRYTEESAYQAAERLLFRPGAAPQTRPKNVSRTLADWQRRVKN
jgi:hypothetical protein